MSRLAPLSLVPLLLLAACGATREEGLSLTLSAQLLPAGPVQETEGGVHFLRADGAEVVLHRAFVSLTRLELVPCPETGSRWLWRALAPVGVAHAHGSEDPRVLAAHRVLSLATHRTQPETLHPMHPPPGRYCQLRLLLAPADADAHGLPPEVDMVGRTLLLEGTLRPVGSDTVTPFRLEASTTGVREVTLGVLTLSAQAPRSALLLTLPFNTWLEGVAIGEGQAGPTTLVRVLDSARLTLP